MSLLRFGRKKAPESVEQKVPPKKVVQIELVEDEPKAVEPKPYKLISSVDEWSAMLQEIEEAGICGLDLETTGLDPLTHRVRLCQLSLLSGHVYVRDLWALKEGQPLRDLGRLLENPKVIVIGQNLKFDLSFIQRACEHRLKMNGLFDTMLASQVCWAGFYSLQKTKPGAKNKYKNAYPSHSLEALALRHLGKDISKEKKEYQASGWAVESLTAEQLSYAAQDVMLLFPLYNIFQEILKQNGLERTAEIEFQTIPSVVELLLIGIKLDVEACKAYKVFKEREAQEYLYKVQSAAQIAGFRPRKKKNRKQQEILLNPSSAVDVLEFLQYLGYEITSTSEPTLKDLASKGCTVAEDVLTYRKVSHQAKSADSWITELSTVDDRLHSEYNQFGSVTGRFSAKEPNIQQVPKHGEDGRIMRSMFIASPGCKLVKADFSGIELRIMAKISGDPTMIEMFQKGVDLHKLTASKAAGVPLEEVDGDLRSKAKATNFSLIYGGSPELLQRRSKDEYGKPMTIEEAKSFYDTFFQTCPQIVTYHERQRSLKGKPVTYVLHNHKHNFYSCDWVCATTLTGRKRVWGQREDGSYLSSPQQLYNFPDQGVGVDLLKMCMAEVYSKIPEDVKLVASIHDELILESPESKALEMAKLLETIMIQVGSKILDPVPVEVEVKIVDTWGG